MFRHLILDKVVPFDGVTITKNKNEKIGFDGFNGISNVDFVFDCIKVDKITLSHEIVTDGLVIPEIEVNVFGGLIEKSESKYKKTLAIFNGGDNLFEAGMPSGYELRPYQMEGIRFMLETERCINADGMGLGKTLQAILTTRIRIECGLVKNCLIIVPKATLNKNAEKNWLTELKNLCGDFIEVTHIDGSIKERNELWYNDTHITICTLDTFVNDIESVNRKFDCVIVDEVQCIKNGDVTKRGKTFYNFNKKLNSVKYVIGLSGTPIENKTEDVVNIFRFVNPDLNFENIKDSLCVKNTIKPYIIRRVADDVGLRLTDFENVDVILDMTDEQRKEYDTFTKEQISSFVIKKDDGEETLRKISYMNILTFLLEQKTICNRSKFGDSAKINWIKNNKSKLGKFVCYTNFKAKQRGGREFISGELNDLDPVVHNGSADVDSIKKFSTNGKVFISNPKTVGVGVNGLQYCSNVVVHYDHWWNPAAHKQADARLHRFGQTKNVKSYKLWCDNSIETKLIKNKLLKKEELFNDVIDNLRSDEMPERMRGVAIDYFSDLVNEHFPNISKETVKNFIEN